MFARNSLSIRRRPLPIAIGAFSVATVVAAALVSGCGGSSSGDGGVGAAGGGASGVRTAVSGSKPVDIVMIPKLKGIAYFNACEKGAEEAAKSLPGVTLHYDGPIEGKSDKQIELIESWILKKPDVIAISCNDPDELAPAIKKARSRGIHVITFDADANPKTSGREFLVNQALASDIGETLVDVMAKEAGPAAETVVITSSLTSPNQQEWIKYMKQTMQTKYPKMKIDGIYPSAEDQQKAFAATQSALKAWPNVKGVFGISSTAFPGAADAILQAHLQGKVACTGLATPQPMKPFVDAGVVKTVVLWNAVDLGYLTVYAADALAHGKLKSGEMLNAGRLGKKKVSGDMVLLGKPTLFTKSNIGQFKF